MPYNHSIIHPVANGTAYTGRADGIMSLNEQARFKANNQWAIAISAPSAPTITSVTVSGLQVSVAFTAPSALNGSTITGYTVTSSGGQSASGASSPIVVTNLAVGTSYNFTVVANSTNGNSTASEITGGISIVLNIGQSFGGGFYAGKINDGGTHYYLIVAPKASGENAGVKWGAYGVATGVTDGVGGPTNSAALAALGVAYQSAVFAEGLTIGGYSDWYLPAKHELEVLYYNLKPTTTSPPYNNATYSGANIYAVPERASNYTSNSPAQTIAVNAFRIGETNAFTTDFYWSSTEQGTYNGFGQYFSTGQQGTQSKSSNDSGNNRVRAIRRIAV